MNKAPIKRILIISLTLGIMLAIFAYYTGKDSVKRVIILQYTTNQINIKDSLSSALDGKDNVDNLIFYLTQAKGYTMQNTSFLGNGMRLGNVSGLDKIEKAYYLNRKGQTIINLAIASAAKEGLTGEDILSIEEYISNLDEYFKELNIDYGTAHKKSSRSLLKRIRNSVDKVYY